MQAAAIKALLEAVPITQPTITPPIWNRSPA